MFTTANLLARVLAIFALLLPAAFAQGPALPDGLGVDPRASWRPTLNPTATVTVDGSDRVTLWRSGSPVSVPTNGREGLIVAIEQLRNDAGEWVGVFGRQSSVDLGDRVSGNNAARANGFSGISIVGLDDDPSSSDWAVIAGFTLSQRIGRQKDIAFLNLTIDSWTDRPCQTIEGGETTAGHLYLESIRVLAISNNLKGLTVKADKCTKWPFKGHGWWRLHFFGVVLEDGVDVGDRDGGASEHFVYWDALAGDSEFCEVKARGCKISVIYLTTRYQYRIQRPDGSYVERIAAGKLLIDNVDITDCGELGSWTINICGGLQDVLVRNPRYRVNRDNPNGPMAKWPGGFLQVYVDNKQYELDDSQPISSQSVPVAKGYSLETMGPLPMSDGMQALVDQGAIPWDGRGGARSLAVWGGTFDCANLYPPLFNLRDVGGIEFTYEASGVPAMRIAGVGKFAAFAASGLKSQCGPGLAGSPDGGFGQQCTFFTRKDVPALYGRMTLDGNTIPTTTLNSWRARP